MHTKKGGVCEIEDCAVIFRDDSVALHPFPGLFLANVPMDF